MRLVFGYRHVSGVPNCPCNDPGNYMMMEEDDNNPLSFRMRCWCGSTIRGNFDNQAERDEFVGANA